MWGSIIGDLAGSIYEYSQIKEVSPIVVDELIKDESFYSDDTILTVAVLDAILNDQDYSKYIKEYGKRFISYRPDVTPYFKTSFSPGFIKWLKSDEVGCSMGNGAMMRIAPVGFMFDDLDKVKEESKKATMPSHNNEESIKCAQVVASIIYLARNGYSKNEIIDLLDLNISFKPFTKFNYTCSDTIGNCLYAVFTTDSFESALREVISYGGDTDTNACIVGGMAEAFYGVDQLLVDKAREKVPERFVKVLEKAYK